MNIPQAAQDVVDAIRITTERTTADGRPWCRPSDALAIERWICERSGRFGRALRPLVRLTYAMDLATSGGYWTFLYARLSRLDPDAFRRSFGSQAARARLEGRIEMTGDGLCFLEASMAGSDKSFTVDFAQMPRLAGILDVIHNMLGFEEARALLAPALSDPPLAADEVARTLSAAINRWLAGRLDSAHHRRQARAIRGFLETRGSEDSEAVDDECIFALWEKLSLDPTVEGFRAFRSSARLAIRYRQAMQVAATEFALDAAKGIGDGDGMMDLDRAAVKALDHVAWSSPLATLGTPPADQAKWLSGTDLAFLADLIGGDGTNGPETDEVDPESGERGGLFGPERPDLRLALTVLRCNVFGMLRGAAAQSLLRGEAQVEASENRYEAAAERYRDLASRTSDLMLATAFVLCRHGRSAAAGLVAPLLADDAREWDVVEVLADDDEEEENEQEKDSRMVRIGDRMRVALAEIGQALVEPRAAPARVRPIAGRLRAAYGRVNRRGFREADLSDPVIVEALVAGCEALPALEMTIRAMRDAVDTSRLPERHDTDVPRFLAHFRRMEGIAVHELDTAAQGAVVDG